VIVRKQRICRASAKVQKCCRGRTTAEVVQSKRFRCRGAEVQR